MRISTYFLSNGFAFIKKENGKNGWLLPFESIND